MFEDQIGFERRPTRKMKELHVAFQLEDVYSKDEILEAYINQVNYGRGRYGIEAASQYFFGKAAIQLTLPEAALLAAVINRPEAYSPFANAPAARQRRNVVLRLMADQGYITDAEAQEFMAAPLPESTHEYEGAEIAPYFKETVRQILFERFGADAVYDEGLRVTTTLDLDMQRVARAAMDSGWARVESQSNFRSPKFADVMAEGGSNGAETQYLQGMFLAMDPATGEIRAMIGGRDYDDSKFNRATQALRQPGSTFKPFVYAAAIASGIPASHVIYDSPLMLEQVDGSIYSPRNYDPEFRGPVTLRDAMRTSINTVAVKLGLEVGLETISQLAGDAGISTEVPPYPSTSIGAASVYPIELAKAYTVLANDGVRVNPRYILRVEDADGRLLWSTQPEREQVLDTAVAAIARDLMRTAIDNGSGSPARAQPRGLPYDVPAAGKTGTTNDATDVWFVGFTPDLLAAVWLGFDRPKTILPRAAGGVYAAPIWGEFMRKMYYPDGAPADSANPEEAGLVNAFEIPPPWQWPDRITTRMVDRKSGTLASSWCAPEDAYLEFFLPGTEPTELCRPESGLFGGPVRSRFRPDTTALDTLRPRRPRRDF
jgi:penicillin-binding protein 1A